MGKTYRSPNAARRNELYRNPKTGELQDVSDRKSKRIALAKLERHSARRGYPINFDL